MSFQYVNANGEPLNIKALEGKHAPIKTAKETLKRTDDRTVAKVSDGFLVLGYTPEAWADIEVFYGYAVKANESEPNKNKHPGTLAEFTQAWMNKNKPKRARTKPYELESAADQCAELCRKAGWVHVRVEELMKG
jgi:hypothetical protein